MGKISEMFENLLPVLVEAGRSAVRNNVRYGDKSALDMFLKGFNEMMEDEFDGRNYIFCLNDKDDLKYLVDKEIFSASQIADLFPKCTASGLFRFSLDGTGCPTGAVEIITLPKLKEILCNNMDMLIRCVLMYVARSTTYGEIYELLVVDNLVESDFSTLW